MAGRVMVAIGITATTVLGIVYAYNAGQMGSELLFNSAWLLVFAMPFSGMLAAGLVRRIEPRIEKDRVLRHDGPAILSHWTHGVGTAILLGSGIALGFLFVPTFLGGGEPIWVAMNIHFVAVLLFLFGTFFYMANTVISAHRLPEHLPTKNFLDYTIRHYGPKFGFKKGAPAPPEDKYFESEKMAYLLAVAATGLVLISGLFKVAAHAVDLPAGLMGFMTLMHGVGTLLMLFFFVAHIFAGSIIPSSWPALRSMITGYMPLEVVEEEHAGWHQRLTQSDGGASSSADTTREEVH